MTIKKRIKEKIGNGIERLIEHPLEVTGGSLGLLTSIMKTNIGSNLEYCKQHGISYWYAMTNNAINKPEILKFWDHQKQLHIDKWDEYALATITGILLAYRIRKYIEHKKNI